MGTIWTRLRDAVTERDPVDVTLTLTLLLLLVSPGPPEHWMLTITVGLLAMIGVLAPEVRRDRKYWLVIAGLMLAVNVFYNWEHSDNHKYLISFWCLAVAVSLFLRNPREGLATNGRLLVGLCFLFATVWKLTSATYMDGSMFEFLLVTDPRFFALADMFGGVTAEMSQYNSATLQTIHSQQAVIAFLQHGQLETAPLRMGDTVPAFAQFLTWWTVILEGALAVVFLAPAAKLEKARHWAMIIFAVTTYPPTNVIQFGWVLLVMGYAATPAEDRKLRLAYVAAFLFVFIFSTGGLRELYFQSAL